MGSFRVLTNASNRLKGIKGSNFSVDLEYNREFLILHLPHLDRFEKTTINEMKSLLKDWWPFFNTVGYSAIYAAIPPDNKVVNKLVTRLGFKFVTTAGEYLVYTYKGE